MVSFVLSKTSKGGGLHFETTFITLSVEMEVSAFVTVTLVVVVFLFVLVVR